MKILFLFITLAFAHGDAKWIEEGRYRNSAGTLCCAEDECHKIRGVVPVTLPAKGYRLPSGEFIPIANVQPSIDGNFWRCKRPLDNSTRCFFAPNVGY